MNCDGQDGEDDGGDARPPQVALDVEGVRGMLSQLARNSHLIIHISGERSGKKNAMRAARVSERERHKDRERKREKRNRERRERKRDRKGNDANIEEPIEVVQRVEVVALEVFAQPETKVNNRKEHEGNEKIGEGVAVSHDVAVAEKPASWA